VSPIRFYFGQGGNYVEGGKKVCASSLLDFAVFHISFAEGKKYIIADKEQKEYNRNIRSIEEEQNRL
jgi:hypothetical protein